MYDEDEQDRDFYSSPKLYEFYDYILTRARVGCRAVKFDQIMHMKFYLDEMIRMGYPINILEETVDVFREQLLED